MRATAVSVITCTVLAFTTGCQSGTEPPQDAGTRPGHTAVSLDPSPSTSSADTRETTAPSSSPDPVVGVVPPFPKHPSAQTYRMRNRALLGFTGLRVGHHEDFDRIVLEFSGNGTPGWYVDYVDQPSREGSGEVVRLQGDAFLLIVASGTTVPVPGYYDGPHRIRTAGGRVVELFVDGTFEGYTGVIAGIADGAAPFRVFALAHPARLVVDVA